MHKTIFLAIFSSNTLVAPFWFIVFCDFELRFWLLFGLRLRYFLCSLLRYRLSALRCQFYFLLYFTSPFASMSHHTLTTSHFSPSSVLTSYNPTLADTVSSLFKICFLAQRHEGGHTKTLQRTMR